MDGGVAADAAAATGIIMLLLLLLRGLAQVEGRGVKTVRSSTREAKQRGETASSHRAAGLTA